MMPIADLNRTDESDSFETAIEKVFYGFFPREKVRFWLEM
jgi:hypothetical protein